MKECKTVVQIIPDHQGEEIMAYKSDTDEAEKFWFSLTAMASSHCCNTIPLQVYGGQPASSRLPWRKIWRCHHIWRTSPSQAPMSCRWWIHLCPFRVVLSCAWLNIIVKDREIILCNSSTMSSMSQESAKSGDSGCNYKYRLNRIIVEFEFFR